MELADIRKSVLNMTEEELRSCLLAIRQSRRVTKKAPTNTSKKKVSTSGDSNASIEALIGSLSHEQVLQMLAKMEGGSK